MRKLRRRGLRGVKLGISDAHEGIKAAVSKLPTPLGNAAASTSCATRLPVLPRAGGASSPPLSPPLSSRILRRPPGPSGALSPISSAPSRPKLATFMDQAEPDVLASMTFPEDHRTKSIGQTDLERLNGEIKRRTDVVGIFPNEEAITRPIGAILSKRTTNGRCNAPDT